MPQFVSVRDVAEVIETYREPEGFTRINGKPGLLVNVMKASNENTVVVANRVRAAIKDVREDVPDLEIEYVMDQSEFIERSPANLAESGLFGGLLTSTFLTLFVVPALYEVFAGSARTGCGPQGCT